MTDHSSIETVFSHDGGATPTFFRFTPLCPPILEPNLYQHKRQTTTTLLDFTRSRPQQGSSPNWTLVIVTIRMRINNEEHYIQKHAPATSNQTIASAVGNVIMVGTTRISLLIGS